MPREVCHQHRVAVRTGLKGHGKVLADRSEEDVIAGTGWKMLIWLVAEGYRKTIFVLAQVSTIPACRVDGINNKQ